MNPRDVRFVLLAILLCVCSCTHAAERTVRRWAIVAADNAALPLADLLSAELSDSKNIKLVERQQIQRILDEHRLGASGLVDPDQAVRIGRLMSADAMVIITAAEETESDDQSLRIRFVDTRTSMRLLDEAVPRSGLDEAAAALGVQLKSRSATLEVPGAQLRLISVAPIMSGEPGHHLRPFCKILTLLVAAELQARPEWVVLEREDLQRLRAEGGLSGIELDLLGATRLLEASLRRSNDSQGITASCRITSPGDAMAHSFEVHVDSQELLEVRNEIVAAVMNGIGDYQAYDPAPLENEARIFDQRCRHFSHSYRAEESAEMAEAAYALAPNYERLGTALVRYNSLVLHYRRKQKPLEMLLAARRHNELLLEQARQYPRAYRGFSFPRGVEPVFSPLAAPSKPPTPRIEYQHVLTAGSDEELRVLRDITSLRRKVLDVRIANAQNVPRLQVYHLLQRLDLELNEVQHAANPAGLVADVLRRAFDLTAAADIAAGFHDPWYRAIVSRMVSLVGKVYRAHQVIDAQDSSIWKTNDVERWMAQLEELESSIATATSLLWRIGLDDPVGQRSAAELLDTVDRFPSDALSIDEIDEVFRLPALMKVPSGQANQYGRELVERALQRGENAELLCYSHSAPAFVRDLSPEASRKIADQVLSLVSDAPNEDRLRQFRFRVALHRFASKTVPPDHGLSLADAPGPWDRYVARAIPVAGDAQSRRICEIFVDRRDDAIRRGGQLILVRQKPRGMLSIERMNLDDGELRKIGSDIEGSPRPFRRVPVAVSPDAIYVASDAPGFVRLTPDSAEAFTEAEGAASNDVFSLVWRDGNLFVAYTDAFGRFDPVNAQFELFASSTSVEPKNPIDGRGSFFIWKMLADPKHDCLWLAIQDNGPRHQNCGLWKFSPAARNFAHLSKAIVELSQADGGILVNRSNEPRVAWIDGKSARLHDLPEFSHASSSNSWLARPTPNLIRIGDHLIGDNGTLMTTDGETFQVPGSHRWDSLQRVGSGFITHYDDDQQVLWYVEPVEAKANP